MKPMTDDEYLWHRGFKCPNCRAQAVHTEEPEDGVVCTTPCECRKCGAMWNEIYMLSGYSDLTLPDGTTFTPED